MNVSRTRRNLCGQVVHDLGCEIVSGRIEPGTALPQEMSLCEQMGVSRTVVREAIKSLAAKGMVESRPKRGTIVCSERNWNYLDPHVLEWQKEFDMTGKFLLHLAEFRQTIEPTAAALAAERATDDEICSITEACNEMTQNADDVESFLSADMRFHTEILHATGNSFFAPVANVVGAALESSLRVTNREPRENRESLPLHEAVAKAIAKRKPDKARKAMHVLLSDATNRIKEATSNESGSKKEAGG